MPWPKHLRDLKSTSNKYYIHGMVVFVFGNLFDKASTKICNLCLTEMTLPL